MENGKQAAFPYWHESLTQEFETKGEGGLTKREYFAAMIAQGLCAKEGWGERLASEGDGNNTLRDHIAKGSIRMADELLKQLENNNN